MRCITKLSNPSGNSVCRTLQKIYEDKNCGNILPKGALEIYDYVLKNYHCEVTFDKVFDTIADEALEIYFDLLVKNLPENHMNFYPTKDIYKFINKKIDIIRELRQDFIYYWCAPLLDDDIKLSYIALMNKIGLPLICDDNEMVCNDESQNMHYLIPMSNIKDLLNIRCDVYKCGLCWYCQRILPESYNVYCEKAPWKTYETSMKLKAFCPFTGFIKQWKLYKYFGIEEVLP